MSKVSSSAVAGDLASEGNLGAVVTGMSCDGPNDSHATVEQTHKRCSGCGKLPRPNQRYCKSCHAAYMRGWREQHMSKLPKSGIAMISEKIKAATNG